MVLKINLKKFVSFLFFSFFSSLLNDVSKRRLEKVMRFFLIQLEGESLILGLMRTSTGFPLSVSPRPFSNPPLIEKKKSPTGGMDPHDHYGHSHSPFGGGGGMNFEDMFGGGGYGGGRRGGGNPYGF